MLPELKEQRDKREHEDVLEAAHQLGEPQKERHRESTRDSERESGHQPYGQVAHAGRRLGRVRGEGHLQHQHRQERADRVDEDPLRFEHGLQPRAQAQVPHEWTDDSRAGDNDQRAEEGCQHPRPQQPHACRQHRAYERDQRTGRDEVTDDTFLAPESRQVEIERAFEQDDGDGEIDQDEQAVTERLRPDPSKACRPERRPGPKQENDRGYPYEPGYTLDRHAGHQRHGHDEGCTRVGHNFSRRLS